MRDMGKIAFFKIEDGTGRIQIYFRINDIGEEAYRTLKLLDIGDFIQVTRFSLCDEDGRAHVACARIFASCPRGCVHCRRSIMGWKIRRCASASATWI